MTECAHDWELRFHDGLPQAKCSRCGNGVVDRARLWLVYELIRLSTALRAAEDRELAALGAFATARLGTSDAVDRQRAAAVRDLRARGRASVHQVRKRTLAEAAYDLEAGRIGTVEGST